MDKVSVALYVMFEDPLWIGILERTVGDELSACKVNFGPEPKDYEVYGFFLSQAYRLRFSPAVQTTVKAVHHNAKRIQREVHRQMADTSMGTKSQQALKLQQEAIKTVRKQTRRWQNEAEKQRQFELKQQKRKEKHRGH